MACVLVNPGLFWRTARHLTWEQALQSCIRVARHAVRHRYPKRAGNRIRRLAGSLPCPNPAVSRFRPLVAHVLALQQAVHGDHADAASGRFRFLGRDVDFGSFAAIEWRRPLDEESSPLWRLTLAYFGWAVPWVEQCGASALSGVAQAVASLERASDWSEPGIFRDLWNPYTASHRLINLLAAVSLYRTTGGQPSKDEDIVLEHARFCAAHIADDLERDLQLNHLLKNYVALTVFAAALPTVPASLTFLLREVPRAIRQNVLSDGGHAERSPMYHALGLLDLQLLRDSRVFESAWQPQLNDAIRAMSVALGYMTHPDGDIALFSDAWLGGAPLPVRLGIQHPGDGRHGLPATGYVQLAADGDSVILDCGAIGPDFNPAHGHADYLSIEASIAGQRFIVDFGTPTYVAGPLRAYCRSAESHNGPRLEGIEPVELWKSFRVGRRTRAGALDGVGLDRAPLWAAGWHDSVSPSRIGLKRWIGLWPGQGFVVVDAWPGEVSGRAVSDFLIASPWRSEGMSLSFTGPGSVHAAAIVGEAENLGPATWWPRYGEEAPATRLRIRPNADGVAALGFFRGMPPDSVAAAVSAIGSALTRLSRSTARRDSTIHLP